MRNHGEGRGSLANQGPWEATPPKFHPIGKGLLHVPSEQPSLGCGSGEGGGKLRQNDICLQ